MLSKPYKAQIVNILALMDHIISATTAQLCLYQRKTAVDNIIKPFTKIGKVAGLVLQALVQALVF